jgi:diguanylate cyclase (GGDEF)-like protein/PAS domain S-box-containing protein
MAMVPIHAPIVDENEASDTGALLEMLTSKTPLGFAFVDRDLRIVRLNEVLATVNGSTVRDQLGQLVADVIPDLWPQVEPLYRHVLDSGEPVLDVKITGPSSLDTSKTHHWLASYYPISRAGVVVGIGTVTVDITDRIEAEQQHERILSITDGSGDAIFSSTELSIVNNWNPSAEALFGFSADEIIGESVERLAPAEGATEYSLLWGHLSSGGLPERLETTRRRKDGSLVDVLMTVSPVRDHAGALAGLSFIAHDITQEREAERDRRAAEERFEISFQQAGIGAALVGLDGVPTRVNHAVCDLLARPKEQLIGRRWTDYNHPDEIPLWQVLQAKLVSGIDSFSDERRYLRPNGSTVWASVHIRTVRNSSGVPEYYFMQLLDITDTKRMEVELAHRALHDTLTGLPNRALLTDRLTHGLERSRRLGSRLGVMFLDIDDFKDVNDSLGHSCGDELLRVVARRVQGAIRPGDSVARFGGDEFVVVCDEISVPELDEIASRILVVIREPIQIEDNEIHITASIGLIISDDEATAERLLQDSDLAMYRAKQHGRDKRELYDKTLRANAELRLVTTAALRLGLERNEFTVYYQPVVDLVTGSMVSAEALVRWEHPNGILVSPDEFIPLAEQTGMIIPIGAWVLEQACQHLIEWQEMMPSMSIAVNLSVRQVLDQDITKRVEEVLLRTGVSGSDLSLELTESLLMEDVHSCARTLVSLKALGIRLVIDDFGMGYSSLSYLKKFPFDAVKVDRSFVDGLGIEDHDTALVAAIVAMAAALDLEVTAEGVETRDQQVLLQGLHCPRAQGYYLAKPMPFVDMSRLVRSSHHWQVD